MIFEEHHRDSVHVVTWPKSWKCITEGLHTIYIHVGDVCQLGMRLASRLAIHVEPLSLRAVIAMNSIQATYLVRAIMKHTSSDRIPRKTSSLVVNMS